jgi:predicted enzyme related to lactoylglutathione lyase
MGTHEEFLQMPNPFAHIELTTDDLAKAEKFYRSVFAWKLRPMKGMNYTMIEVGEGVGGGMQSKPMPEAPTGWMPYVGVDDVKKTMAKAVQAGASAMLEYQEIGTWERSACSGILPEPCSASGRRRRPPRPP